MKERLNDPAFYEKWSPCSTSHQVCRRGPRITQYLKRIAELAKQVSAGVADDTPEALKASPGLRAIYNNLKTATRRGGNRELPDFP